MCVRTPELSIGNSDVSSIGNGTDAWGWEQVFREGGGR